MHLRMRRVVLTVASMLTLALTLPTSTPASACGIEPFIGIICIAPYNFEPRGYAFAQGQILPISGNIALFSLLGTTYGGNGRTTFALPDLRGRVPVGAGGGNGLSLRVLGETGGLEAVTLGAAQMPNHTHVATTAVSASAMLRASRGNGNTDTPTGAVLARLPRANEYSMAAPDVAMRPSAISVTVNSASTTNGFTGGDQPHENMPPFLVLNYIIALQGIFPSRN